jgi:hypothetical protein
MSPAPCSRATKAETELDSRARPVMKRDGVSYPQACSRVLTEDPSLYTKYQAEMAAGDAYLVPEPLAKAAGDNVDDPESDDANGECPECGEDVDDGDKFCSDCGADLKAKVKAQAVRSKK